MKRFALKFGLISGAILCTMTAVMLPLCMKGVVDFDKAEIVGYTSMVLAFLLVFFGIRSYREEVGRGVITFGRAFKVGILITLVASAVYVVSWQIVYWGFIPDFGETYSAYVVEKMEREGASSEAVEAKAVQMAEFSRLYRNPLFNVAVTFMEVFPVGLVVTLVSAGILRRRHEPGEASDASA